MKQPKITEPVTDNKERAQAENRRAAAGRTGSPSRAHEQQPKQRHSKKTGGTAPKRGGTPTS